MDKILYPSNTGHNKVYCLENKLYKDTYHDCKELQNIRQNQNLLANILYYNLLLSAICQILQLNSPVIKQFNTLIKRF